MKKPVVALFREERARLRAELRVSSREVHATGSTASRPTPAGPTSRATGAEEPARPRRRRVWPWLAAGGAVAFAGAGLGLWLSGRAGYDEYLTTTDHARFLELQDSVPRRYHAADAMLGVAVVLAVTSAVLLVVEARGRRAEPRAAWLVPAGLGLRGEL